MAIPADLKYNKSHEWVRREGDAFVVGITHYAQDQLGEVVYVELPDPGSSFETDEEIGSLESVKAVSELFAPLAGEIVEVNEALADEPNLVNDDPYGKGWLVKIAGPDEGELLSAAEYEELLKEESH